MVKLTKTENWTERACLTFKSYKIQKQKSTKIYESTQLIGVNFCVVWIY